MSYLVRLKRGKPLCFDFDAHIYREADRDSATRFYTRTGAEVIALTFGLSEADILVEEAPIAD